MSLKPLKITFHMDGTGVAMWPKQPVHLDGLIAWCLMPFHKLERLPSPNEEPYEIGLPLGKWRIDGEWGWHASALFPEGEFFETTQYYRKKLRVDRIHLLPKLNIVTQGGRYAEKNVPMPLLLCEKLIGYCLGDKRRILDILKRQVRYIGKMGNIGKGRVISVEVEIIDEDFSLVKDGRAMRFLPMRAGMRFGRIRPPYHNNFASTSSCYPGDIYNT